MAGIPAGAERLLKPFELGLWVARGRRRAKVSHEAFAQKLGVSRKTISDLERGVADYVSLKTAMAALSLAGFVIYCAERRPPTMEEIMARRAADRARADELLNAGVTPSLPTPASPTKDQTRADRRATRVGERSQRP